MIIPVGYLHVQHFFGGSSVPNGAAVTYGLGGFGAGTLPDLAEELHDLWATSWQPVLTATTWLLETRVKAGPNATGPFASHVETVFGAITGESVPPNTALLVEKRTDLGGRSGRGRMFVPGVGDSAVAAGGDIAPTSLADYQAVANAWLTGLETTTTGMFILHTASSDPTRVTSLTVDPIAATQRRRLR